MALRTFGSYRVPPPARPGARGSTVDLIIGTYTEQLPHVNGKAGGVLTASFDPASGRIGPVSSLAATRNPSYLATSASGENVYVDVGGISKWINEHPRGTRAVPS
jgi:hypothetical protein